jgi:hypothetical protein
MNKLEIQGKELRTIGYPRPVISVAMNIIEKNL